LNLISEVAYTDGLGGRNVDHDWSYANAGVSTTVKITDDLTFVPAVYYQLSMDDSVNEHDELYGILSMKLRF
jgi:hypothetical protein